MSKKTDKKSSSSLASKLIIWVLVISMAIPAIASFLGVILN